MTATSVLWTTSPQQSGCTSSTSNEVSTAREKQSQLSSLRWPLWTNPHGSKQSSRKRSTTVHKHDVSQKKRNRPSGSQFWVQCHRTHSLRLEKFWSSKRAATLRNRVRHVRKYIGWLAAACGLPFPTDPIHVPPDVAIGQRQQRIVEVCAPRTRLL